MYSKIAAKGETLIREDKKDGADGETRTLTPRGTRT